MIIPAMENKSITLDLITKDSLESLSIIPFPSLPSFHYLQL